MGDSDVSERGIKVLPAMCLCIAAAIVVTPISAAGQDFQAGREAYQRGDYETTLRELEPLAESGHAIAQSLLGVLYARGHGVPLNKEKAARWFRRAADQGVAEAQYNLGRAYRLGEGLPQDWDEATKWYRSAADQSYPLAQTQLGFLYADGQGVAQDHSRAARWLRKAAEQGRAKAQLRLGALYVLGKGVVQDYVSAHMWFNMASANGSEEASGFRDNIANLMMTDADISEAQRRARVCMESDYQECD